MRQVVPFACKSERQLANYVLGRLNQWFIIDREVGGTHCSGKRLRLDAVIRPRDTSGWKEPGCAFGIEFKLPDDFSDTRDYTRWAAQAIDYTHTDWDGYGRLFVFLCPSFSERLGQHHPDRATILMKMLGQLGVGEIAQLKYHGLTLMMQADHRLWSEASGVASGRHWGLRPKVGSR